MQCTWGQEYRHTIDTLTYVVHTHALTYVHETMCVIRTYVYFIFHVAQHGHHANRLERSESVGGDQSLDGFFEVNKYSHTECMYVHMYVLIIVCVYSVNLEFSCCNLELNF